MAAYESEEVLEDVGSIRIVRQPKRRGYAIKTGERQIDALPAANFEFRIVKPIEINHMYVESSLEEPEQLEFSVDFNLPSTVRIQYPGTRCYLYVSQ